MSASRASWDHLWTPLSKDRLSGFVSTLKQAEAVREAYEVDKSTFFVSRCKAAHFGEHANSIQNRFRIRYKDLKDAVVPYDGVPFIIQSRYERDCMFGKDKHKATKDRLLAAREEQIKNNEPIPKRSRRVQKWSRKQGCPAKIIMKEVIRFPSFRLKVNTEFVRRITSERLRTALESGKQLVEEHRVYIRFPRDDDHDEAHRAGLSTGCMHPLNEDVRKKLDELTVDGTLNSVKVLLRHLRTFVQTELFKDQPLPAKSDLSYYPMYGTVRKYMQMARLRQNVVTSVTINPNPSDPLHLRLGPTDAERPDMTVAVPPPTTSCELEMHAVDVAAGEDWTDDHELSVRELASVCRDKLTSIRRSTHRCHAADALRQLATMLGQAEEYINWHLPGEVGSASDDAAADVVIRTSRATKRRGKRRSRFGTPNRVKKRKLAAAAGSERASGDVGSSEAGDHVGYDMLNMDGEMQLIGRQTRSIDVGDDVGDGEKDMVDEAQPIIHLLFVDRGSEIDDGQYTELTNEQLATMTSLVSASSQQHGMAIQ